ncbi:MAG: hypothetical protein KY432_04080, partial [Acidobacteria bacterium]|nr:hypothetical protein [Acidobacteriota bacterium]
AAAEQQLPGLDTSALQAFLAERGAVIEERNSREQPSRSNLDLRLSKRFNVWGDFGIELIGEVFNALNEENEFVNFFNQSLYSASFRNGAWSFRENENFGQPNAFSGFPRQYQAAVRILF